VATLAVVRVEPPCLFQMHLAVIIEEAPGARRCRRLVAGRAVLEPEHWRFDWSRDYTTAEWLDAVQTFGGWGRIPAGGQREILEGIGEAIGTFGGSFTMRYATVGVAVARS
jgi:hypothetical protein